MTRLSNFVIKICKITGFLCFSTPVFASNVCDKFYRKVDVSSVINYGNVIYKSVPKSEIVSFQKLNNPEKTLGVTVANIQIKYDFDFDRYKVRDGVCVNLSKMNFFVGYPVLNVLIDEKYEKGSCEYNAIKQHEKEHIAIYQRELKYYGNLLIEELRNAVSDISPMFFLKNISQAKVRAKIDDIITKNPNILLIKQKLEKSVVDGNMAFDSEEEYLRVNSQCKNW